MAFPPLPDVIQYLSPMAFLAVSDRFPASPTRTKYVPHGVNVEAVQDPAKRPRQLADVTGYGRDSATETWVVTMDSFAASPVPDESALRMQWSFPASRNNSTLSTTDGVDQYKPGSLFDLKSLNSPPNSITDVSPDSFNA